MPLRVLHGCDALIGVVHGLCGSYVELRSNGCWRLQSPAAEVPAPGPATWGTTLLASIVAAAAFAPAPQDS